MLWLLTTTVSAVVGGSVRAVTSVAGQSVQGVAQVAGSAVSSIDPVSIIEGRIRASGNDPAQALSSAVSEVRALLISPPQNAAQQRDRAAQALARAQNIPIDQAQARVTEFEQQYRQFVSQAQQTATQAATTARRAVSWSAILAALALALGAVAGWYGGQSGTASLTLFGMLGMPGRRPTDR
jgi:hypothetical protein